LKPTKEKKTKAWLTQFKATDLLQTAVSPNILPLIRSYTLAEVEEPDLYTVEYSELPDAKTPIPKLKLSAATFNIVSALGPLTKVTNNAQAPETNIVSSPSQFRQGLMRFNSTKAPSQLNATRELSKALDTEPANKTQQLQIHFQSQALNKQTYSIA
jgi:hypothetical protein